MCTVEPPEIGTQRFSYSQNPHRHDLPSSLFPRSPHQLVLCVLNFPTLKLFCCLLKMSPSRKRPSGSHCPESPTRMGSFSSPPPLTQPTWSPVQPAHATLSSPMEAGYSPRSSISILHPLSPSLFMHANLCAKSYSPDYSFPCTPPLPHPSLPYYL